MKPFKPTRFHTDFTFFEQTLHYLECRAMQLLQFGFTLIKLVETSFGAYAQFEKDSALFYYLCIFDEVMIRADCEERRDFLDFKGHKVIATPDDPFISHLEKASFNFQLIGTFLSSSEYQLINAYYGQQTTARSRAYLMNHIDEGLAILSWINASELTKKAYCLHPILQNDLDLQRNWRNDFSTLSPQALILCMEYRKTANAYLSNREISSLNDIKLSPISEVNHMLIADKVQNYKDFLRYHKYTHPRSKELELYFKNWLEKLAVPIEIIAKSQSVLVLDCRKKLD